MKAIIYLRKSTDDEERQVLSLESQREICLTVAEKHSLEVIDIFEESGSAKVAKRRPIFRRILDMVHAGKIDSIICWKANRLSRNATEGGEIIDLINNNKLIIYCESGMYGRGDTILLHIELGFATKYSQDLSDDVKVGMESKVQIGWRPGKAPLGYKNFGNIKGEKSIVIDAQTAPYVRHMFALALAGKSVVEILDIVTKEGLRVPATKSKLARKLGKTQPYRLLANPFYYGYFYWKGELRKGIHQPLITRDQFDRTQALISSRSKVLKINKDYWWLGLLKCETCGCAITTESKNRKLSDGTYKWHSYARCTKKRGPCNEKYIRVEDLEKQLESFMEKSCLAPKIVERFRKELAERNKREFELATIRRRELTRRQKEIFEKKELLYKMRFDNAIKEIQFHEKLDELLIDEANLDKDDVSLTSWLKDAEIAIDFAGKIYELFKNGNGETKKELFRIYGSDMLVKDKLVWARVKPTFEDMQKWEEEGDEDTTDTLGQEIMPKSRTKKKVYSFRSG